VPLQILHVIADAANAELAEVRQVLANLRRVEVKLFGEGLGRDRFDAGQFELRQASQVDRESIGRQLGYRLVAGLALVR
jgi:hypothetical protein